MANSQRRSRSLLKSKGRGRLAPYGSWKSPITSDMIAQQVIKLSEVRIDGNDIYWLEERLAKEEGGRCVVVRPPDRELKKDYSARTEVHSYGGGAWTVDNGNLYFSNASDGRLYRHDWGTGEPQPLTPKPSSQEKSWRYADGIIDRARKRWIGVCEDHTGPSRYPANAIVTVPLNGPPAAGTILASGNDFYSSPCLSLDGKCLAWLAWNHPNMPWTGSALYTIDLNDDGTPRGKPIQIAGGDGVSLFQPEWSPRDLKLFYVSDQSGWWNLCCYELNRKKTRRVKPMRAEFARAQWYFGMSMYAFAGDSRLVAACVKNGRTSLVSLDLNSNNKITNLELPFTEISSVRADPRDRVVFCGGAPDIPTSIVQLNLRTGHHEILKQSIDVANDPDIKRYFTAAKPMKFQTKGGKPAYALFYRPANPDFVARKKDRPPLLVKCHGGPTSAASSALDLNIQYWTSRGIAVVDVNYGGSTGYGRAYRHRLHKSWGVVDVADCVNAAKHLVKKRKVDRKRSVITGPSAGGYTALAALTFRKYFAGGASYYGVSDLSALAKDTHKFEAHYFDWLIGPYPKEKKIYRARSPLFHASHLLKPVIFFQGDKDPVVPPNQTEKTVRELWRRNVPSGFLLFTGESHGFKKALNIQRALDAELYFYSAQVFHTGLPL